MQRSSPTFRRWALGLLAVLALSSGSVACASGDEGTARTTTTVTDAEAEAPTTASSPPSTTVPRTLAELVPGPETLRGYVATPIGAPEVRRAPDAGSERIDVPATTSLGAPTTFAVLGEPAPPYDVPDRWLQVVLPSRPNASTGWVPARSVEVARTTLRIEVDRSARTLRVLDDDREVLAAPVAVGTDQNPTPVGPSYLVEVVDNPDPGGSYGPFAFGLALHSDTLTEFAGGPGQVGIHGTDRPDLIGQAVSHGCIRLGNEDAQALAEIGLPLGTPVLIS